MLTAARFKYLLDKWLNDRLSQVEVDEFLQSLDSPIAEVMLGESIIDSLKQSTPHHELTEDEYLQLDKIITTFNLEETQTTTPNTKTITIYPWLRVAAAILILPFIGYWGYTTLFKKDTFNEKSKDFISTNYDAPSDTYAVLQMPDGSNISVEDIKDSLIIDKYGLKLKRLPNGEIQYINTEENVNPDLYTTIHNPRKSKPLSLLLNDGSKVLLNVESSITYPVVFDSKYRKVSMEGEVFFEVQKSTHQKFIVAVNNVSTEVLGTSFNVRHYNNEANTKITLVEGSIKVNQLHNSKENILIPNQQAIVQSQHTMIKEVDVDEVLSWKNGIINFNNSDIRSIMEELSRWYDVSVEFMGDIPTKRYTGRISSNTHLDSVLEILRQGGMHFELKDRKILITP